MIKRVAACAALAAASGCASSPKPAATKAPVPALTAVPAASASVPEPPNRKNEADEAVARALQKMARLRELPAKGPVSAAVISRNEMVGRVRDQLRREVPPEVVAATTTMLYEFGAVEADFDLERSLLDLMSAELAGFYEPNAKRMFLLEDLVGPERQATLSHELVHALQDQHYDLGRLIAYREDASDAQSALHSLAEGDATSAMIDEVLAPRGARAIDAEDELVGVQARGMMEANPSARQVPGIIKRSVISSYADGLPFVHWARRRGGWAAVDAAWRKPPATTEQLLHPEKYLASEPALVVPVPSPPADGPKTLAYHDVQGEQSLRILFEEWAPAREAAESAKGWGGDRLAVYRGEGSAAVAWHLRFDDVASAKKAMVTLTRGVLKPEDGRQDSRGPEFFPRDKAERSARQGRVCHARSHRGAFAALRKDADIAVVAGPSRDADSTERPTSSCASALAWAARIIKQR